MRKFRPRVTTAITAATLTALAGPGRQCPANDIDAPWVHFLWGELSGQAARV